MKKLLLIFFVLTAFSSFSQRDTSKYNRKDEVLDDDKRYAIHNNYLSFGPGVGASNIRNIEQYAIGIDFIFHIRRQHFQLGVLMSGDAFLSNNNLSGHAGYCYRIEDEFRNIAFFAGISQNKGQIPQSFAQNGDTIPQFFYRNTGAYLSASYVKKFAYDIGIGFELFADLNQTQQFVGGKVVFFFSGAYKGKGKLYNRYVKRRT